MAGAIEVGRLHIPVEFEVGKQAEQKLKVDAQRVGQQMGVETARKYIEGYERQYQLDIAHIKAGQLRGFITQQQAEEAGRKAAVAYNQGMLRTLSKVGPSGGVGGNSALIAITGSLKNVDAAGRSAGVGLNALRGPLTMLAYSAAGVSPVFARLLSVLGSFAFGSGIMIAVLAGLTAIAAAWDWITGSSSEARDRMKTAMDELRDIKKQQDIEALGPGGAAVDALRRSDMVKQMAEARERVARAAAEVRNPRPAMAGGTLPEIARRELAAANAAYQELVALSKAAGNAIADAVAEAAAKEQAARDAAFRERATQLEREARQLEATLDQFMKDLPQRGLPFRKPGMRVLESSLGGTPDEAAGVAGLLAIEAAARKEKEEAASEEADAQRKRLLDLREQARALEENARAALQVAEAFGMIDSEAAKAIESIIQGASAAVRLIGGDPTAIPSLIGAAASLFSGSPEQARVLKENTAALERLQDGIARLSTALLSERGGQVAGLVGAVGRFAPGLPREWGRDPSKTVMDSVGRFNRELAALGLSMDDVRRIAEGYGITLDDTAESWRALDAAMKQSALKQIFQSASGRQQLLGVETELFDLDPTEQLNRLREIFLDLGKFGDSFKLLGIELPSLMEGMIAGFDLATDEGREGLRDALKGLWKQFVEDPDAFLAQMGDLTADEFMQLMLSMNGLIDTVDETTEAFGALRNVPSGFKVALETFRATSGLGASDYATDGSPRLPRPGGFDPRGDLSSLMPSNVGGTALNISGGLHIHNEAGDTGEDLVEKFSTAVLRNARRGGSSGILPAIMRR